MREPLWRVNLHSGFFHGKEAENLNIHKADEKPYKEKRDIHDHVTERTSEREKVKQEEAHSLYSTRLIIDFDKYSELYKLLPSFLLEYVTDIYSLLSVSYKKRFVSNAFWISSLNL